MVRHVHCPARSLGRSLQSIRACVRVGHDRSQTAQGRAMNKVAAAEPSTDLAARDLILVLADSKRMLGTRYAEWILGAPELETGIACASMAQDEWGHARLLYALLKDFDEDIDRLEHGREPHEYASIELLDRSPGSWAEFVAINALVD